ncbi:MarR family winged helix-turn-helix transcriptional regulator [Streptacidiphilus monticola]|uniref:MarR family winged helix-turn-helix transcriptional regulator n=1 Tax=Streptacidiphilus monticola TaxID=2161674 RepID=A0ABW1G4X4_9ACTN
MSTTDAVAASDAQLSQGWHTLYTLHGRIEARLDHELQSKHGLSLREYCLLSTLRPQHSGEGGHLRMAQVAEAVVLSQSATTRLVTRLEDRGLLTRYLCATDRRGIYTDVTPAGLALLAEAEPTHFAVLREAMTDAAAQPELEPLVRAVAGLHAEPAASRS